MNKLVRVGVCVVAVGLLAGACSVTAPRGSDVAGSRPPASASAGPATPTPSTAEGTPGPVPDVLGGQRYAFHLQERPSFTIVGTGPDGWTGYSWALDGPDPVRAAAPNGIGIAFLTPDGVYSDPCHWDILGTGEEGQPGDVAVGPSVDDLVAALRANTFYTASAATPVTIDGYAGQELELQLPDDPFTTCDRAAGDVEGHAFVFSGMAGLFAQGRANKWHLFILDADGTRLIAVVLSYAGTPQADLDTALNVVDTLEINP